MNRMNNKQSEGKVKVFCDFDVMFIPANENIAVKGLSETAMTEKEMSEIFSFENRLSEFSEINLPKINQLENAEAEKDTIIHFGYETPLIRVYSLLRVLSAINIDKAYACTVPISKLYNAMYITDGKNKAYILPVPVNSVMGRPVINGSSII